jgi:hypothetical protein
MADTDRQDLHTLVDHIPAGEVPAARKILRALMDPVELSLLSAPVDDEPETEDERSAVERALAESCPGTSHEEVLRADGRTQGFARRRTAGATAHSSVAAMTAAISQPCISSALLPLPRSCIMGVRRAISQSTMA